MKSDGRCGTLPASYASSTSVQYAHFRCCSEVHEASTRRTSGSGIPHGTLRDPAPELAATADGRWHMHLHQHTHTHRDSNGRFPGAPRCGNAPGHAAGCPEGARMPTHLHRKPPMYMWGVRPCRAARCRCVLRLCPCPQRSLTSAELTHPAATIRNLNSHPAPLLRHPRGFCIRTILHQCCTHAIMLFFLET